MAVFLYTALTHHRETLEGSIAALDEADAKSKLAGLGLVPVTLEYSDDGVQVDAPEDIGFEFSGMSEDGQFVEGTLEATDRVEALRMLLHTHKIRPDYLCEVTASDSEKRYMREGGMGELIGQLDEGEKVSFQKQPEVSRVLSDAEKAFFAQIDGLAQETSDVLSQYGKDLSVQEKLQLQSKIQDILRLKLKRDFRALDALKRDLSSQLARIRKREGEIVDEDLKRFFQAFDDHDNLFQYAEHVRKFDNRRKLLLYELSRLFRGEGRRDAFSKVRVVLMAGRLPSEESHHPAWYELHRFIGALLVFYLILFGAGYYITSKELSFRAAFLESMVRNVLLHQIVLILFGFYCLLTLKLFFLPAKRVYLFLFLLFVVSLVGSVLSY